MDVCDIFNSYITNVALEIKSEGKHASIVKRQEHVNINSLFQLFQHKNVTARFYCRMSIPVKPWFNDLSILKWSTLSQTCSAHFFFSEHVIYQLFHCWYQKLYSLKIPEIQLMISQFNFWYRYTTHFISVACVQDTLVEDTNIKFVRKSDNRDTSNVITMGHLANVATIIENCSKKC